MDELFLEDDSGDRICGSEACPYFNPPEVTNVTEDDSLFFLPCKTSAMLASVFLGCSVMGRCMTKSQQNVELRFPPLLTQKETPISHRAS